MKKEFHSLLFVALSALLAACSTTKFVPEGSYLLDEVRIHTDNKEVKPSSLSMYVRQKPNSKWFSLLKTQLYVYNWSGRDSTRWINRTLRRIGDAPVIYNEEETRRSSEEMKKAVQNIGYMGANVEYISRIKKKKLQLTYRVRTGKPYVVRSLKFDIPDEKIRSYMLRDSASTHLSNGMTFDINLLDKERQRITNMLLQYGYYKFNKEYLTYTADTVQGTYKVDLTLHLALYRPQANQPHRPHPQYTIEGVSFITDYNMLQSSTLGSMEINDSIHYRGIPIYYKDRLFLRPKVLFNNLRITSHALYNEQEVQRTYANYGRLPVLKYTNIRFFETQRGDSALLNAYVMLTRNKHQSISFELEGTNSAGDLGAAASVSYQNRNVFKGSETFLIKLRGAYEAVSGLQSSNGQDNYTELGAETSIHFPRFLFPFLSNNLRRRIRATTEFGLQYNYQLRPEFSRIVASASWSYRWGLQRQRSQHRIDLLDVNYLYMPWIDPDFQNKYLNNEHNYILQYNYKDRLIVRAGYSYTYNSRGQSPLGNTVTGNSYTLRFNIESAGNVLYLFSKMAHAGRNANGEYTLLSIPYAQYVKGDIDFAKNIVIDNRNSIAFHVAGGIAIPYGNASLIPFEKRYFSGGANSVRGWSVRSLGPGSFAGDGNFLNQSGDIKLDLSIEYRTRLFWKFRGALFVDAGNIWTLRDYADQEGGKFKLNSFYKEIAVAYGLGLRLDLDFFILRFDGGMKALNPVYKSGKERYPLLHPRFKRDFAFHFAVGYPF
ncbi:MAG: BamA/TamA family outer membrane protein [Prevotellaceae bacterium]|jgi:outer membrane protein assembly factor BamA|nr:BamA/TamA family outer membrane protein [Prevotellaceae bacterium]